jgi:large subunit ribosomal protein L19
MSISSPIIEALEKKSLRTDLAQFRVGDTVAVHYKIVEGDKLRVQVFRGTVIRDSRSGLRSTVTVRKVSFNVGVERTFLLHSPRLEKIELVSQGVVRRARLFYLRNLAGKAARIRDAKDRRG